MYITLLVLVLVGGWVPATLFLLVHRPPRWRDLISLDASGWVVIIWLLYAWTGYRLATGRARTAIDVTSDRAIGLVIGVGIDVLVWLRLVHWLRFYRYRVRKHRSDAEE